MAEEAQKFHYYLVNGTLLYKVEDDDAMYTINLNGVLRGKKQEITVRALASAQHVLQAVFHAKNPELKYAVQDCIINNIVYCGYFLPEEFNDMELPKEEKAEE